MNATGKPVYVTGAKGFIGAHLVEELLARGHNCIALDRRTLDLTDREAVKAFFAAHPPGPLIHAAAKIPSFGDDTLENMLRQNVLTTDNLWNATNDYFVLCSTLDVYGMPVGLPIAEDSPERPRTDYAISKLTAEKLVQARAHASDRKAAILRISHVYGPNDRPIKLIPKIIAQIRQGDRPCVFGDGSDLRDFIHVRDVARAVRLVVEQQPIGIFNIATGESISVLETVKTIIAVAGHQFEPILKPAHQARVDFRFDILKLRNLGFEPREDLAVALRELCR